MLFDWTSEGQDKDIEARLGVGRVRARQLYDVGYVTPESLVDVGEQRIGAIIEPKVARNVIREVEMGGGISGT